VCVCVCVCVQVEKWPTPPVQVSRPYVVNSELELHPPWARELALMAHKRMVEEARWYPLAVEDRYCENLACVDVYVLSS
jgi:hypothetical protein